MPIDALKTIWHEWRDARAATLAMYDPMLRAYIKHKDRQSAKTIKIINIVDRGRGRWAVQVDYTYESPRCDDCSDRTGGICVPFEMFASDWESKLAVIALQQKIEEAEQAVQRAEFKLSGVPHEVEYRVRELSEASSALAKLRGMP